MTTRPRIGQKVPRVVLAIGGLLLVIALIAVILTVWSRFTAVPSTVLTSPACQAPCWYGIRPGETTAAAVLTFLSEQPFVQGSSVRVWPSSGDINQIAWFFQRPAGDTAGYAYFESEQCTALTIVAQGSLKIADTFGKLGPPQLLWTQTGKAGARAWVEVDLIYPTAGYVVEADIDAPAKSEKPQVQISAQTPVMRFTYFDTKRFQALLGAGTLTSGPFGPNQNELRPWPGLGPIDFTRP